tara:strand:- start:164 stop:352 length:189 start_codon:yes stop_codon:yes gene_type:complete
MAHINAIENEIFESYRVDQRELKADKLADKFSSKLFADDDVTVRQANHVYVHLKKLLMKTLK